MQKIILTLLTILMCVVTTAQTRSDLERERADIQREIDDVKRSLDQTKRNRKESLGQLSLLQKKLRLREAAINNINHQINYIQGNINQSRNEIIRLKKELDTLKVQYERSVVYAYKNRSNYDFLNFIFSASNFNDALKRVEYLKSYRNYREIQAGTIYNTQSLLQKKISGLELSRREKDEVLQKQEKEKKVLVVEKKEKDMVLSKLKSREKELMKEFAAKRKADNKLRAAIKAAIDRETKLARVRELEEIKRTEGTKPKTTSSDNTVAREKKVSKSVFESTPEGAIVSDNFEKNRGKLPWPVESGHVKTPFGNYSVAETKIVGNNPGITIEMQSGASVKAVFDGDVSSVFEVEGVSAVMLRHGKYFTTYSGLSSVNVSKGSKVKAGQVMGRAADNEDGNGEIEFLLMQENRNLNPEVWLRRK
ncbi:MAG TPA: peptidoglycan DD-metalloendopeptidase family protein [Flavitalea sp.]|nr:peptidoglycan DD-metalloendopeptidase family protein [Flavitalea sp.]